MDNQSYLGLIRLISATSGSADINSFAPILSHHGLTVAHVGSFKGTLRPKSEHFLKKRKYEKLGFSEIN